MAVPGLMRPVEHEAERSHGGEVVGQQRREGVGVGAPLGLGPAPAQL